MPNYHIFTMIRNAVADWSCVQRGCNILDLQSVKIFAID